MKHTTSHKAMKVALQTFISLSVSGFLFTSNAQANTNYQEIDNLSSSSSSVIARNSTAPIKEFIVTKLYQHSVNNGNAITLHFQNIPLLTFFDTPNSNALENATRLAMNLEQISEDSSLGDKITVTWNNKTQNYSIQLEGKELTPINDYITLPDATDNTAHDALQATNRLRRLVGNASPLKEIKNKPKISTRKERQLTVFNPIKNLSRAVQGIASWYGPGFHGRRTASGETFNQNALTAAHRSLPFGTRIMVTNLRNGRSVVVRVNDRGPFTRGRIVDLSAGAARAIGLKSSGIAPVRIQVVNN